MSTDPTKRVTLLPPRGGVTLVPTQKDAGAETSWMHQPGTTDKRFRVVHDESWKRGDFLPLELRDGSAKGQLPRGGGVPAQGRRPQQLPPVPARTPLFGNAWNPPVVQHRQFVQEHMLETADPQLSPWWQCLSAPAYKQRASSVGPLAPVRVGAQAAPPPRRRAPAYHLRPYDARLTLSIRGPEFAHEMEMTRARLASAQESRARPPSSVAGLIAPGPSVW